MNLRSRADFIMTQLFYDVDNFIRWLRKVRARGMCFSTAAMKKYLSTYNRHYITRDTQRHADSELCLLRQDDKVNGCTCSRFCRSGPRTHPRSYICFRCFARSNKNQQHDDQKVKDYGVDLAVQMVKRLTEENHVKGVHFCTLNLEKSVRRILEGLGWAHEGMRPRNKIIRVRITSDSMISYCVDHAGLGG